MKSLLLDAPAIFQPIVFCISRTPQLSLSKARITPAIARGFISLEATSITDQTNWPNSMTPSQLNSLRKAFVLTMGQFNWAEIRVAQVAGIMQYHTRLGSQHCEPCFVICRRSRPTTTCKKRPVHEKPQLAAGARKNKQHTPQRHCGRFFVPILLSVTLWLVGPRCRERIMAYILTGK